MLDIKKPTHYLIKSAIKYLNSVIKMISVVYSFVIFGVVFTKHSLSSIIKINS